MPNHIKLSHNELRYMLKTVFEGAYGHSRDIGAMAETIGWLEASGLSGIDMLLKVLPALSDVPSARTLTALESTDWQYNGEGMTVIPDMDSLCDIARSTALNHGYARLDITDIKSPGVIVSAARCAPQGFNVYARWDNYAARILSGQSFPDIFELDTAAGANMIFTTGANPLPDLPVSKTRKWGADHLREIFDTSLRDGIKVSLQDYNTLTGYAARVLIPDSEASRQGAGE